MGKFKTLASNTLIFGICNFTSKLLVFFMLPFYTAVLTKEEFGTADLIVTVIGLLMPILSLSVGQGCMRFALDKTRDTKKVFTFGFKVSSLGSLLLLFSLPLLEKISFLSDYVVIFALLFIVQCFQVFFSQFARGINKIRLVGIAGVVSSFVVVGSNVILLFIFHFGVYGYLMSMVISHAVAIAILFWGGGMFRFFSKNRDSYLEKEIITYSFPLTPNSLSWWINHSANRLILNHFCGVADVGLYSAASKMPSIIDTFRGIFVQAWQLSTITEYDNKDSVAFFQAMYRGYNLFIIVICTLLITLSQAVAHILYSDLFYEAWQYTPFLLVGVAFSSLIAYYSPFYLAHKKTKILFYSTFAGAIITILFNLLLIPQLGILGASITSMLSNFIIFLWLHIDSRKIMIVNVDSFRYYLSYFVLFAQAVLIAFAKVSPLSVWSLVCPLVIFILNSSDIKFFYQMLRTALAAKKKYKSDEEYL